MIQTPVDPTLTELVEEELSKPSLHRDSVKLRERYDVEREGPRREDTRLTMWGAVIIYTAFFVLDFVLIPDVALATSISRVALAVVSLSTLEFMLQRRAKANTLDATCAGFVVVAYVLWVFFAAYTQHQLSFSYYIVFGAIFMMGANLLFNFPLPTSLAASFALLAAFFVAMLNVVSVPPSYQIAFGVLFISSLAFNFYVNWKLDVERYSVFLNALRSRIQKEELEEQSRALLRLSNTDSLTGLANRRAIDASLRNCWRQWQSSGVSFGVILVDIDYFKLFNDYYGHQEGDRTLALVAETLADFADAHGAEIGRYGGEEFLILTPFSSRETVTTFIESVRRAVENLRLAHEYRSDGLSVVTLSVGASVAGKDCDRLERLVSEADRALYAAKASGRNCVRLYDPDDPHVSDASESIEALLRVAIAQKLVTLVYQPIHDLQSGRLEAVEALMRLKMLDGSVITPAAFIPVAERTGVIHELGRWAIRAACRDLLAGGHVPVVSVNVSAVQLRAPGFPGCVAAILAETGVEPGRLAFEITEGLEIEDNPEILHCVGELQRLGIQIWLDDFGTGFAGLSWLRLIRFDVVKIDRSFLHDSVLPQGEAMLKDMIGLIRNRGPRMVVEGVENRDQIDLLKQCQVELGQGFALGRPSPAQGFLPSSNGGGGEKVVFLNFG